MAKKDEFLEENVEENPEEESEEPTEEEEAPKVKVGEEEYTQEELDRLVKLGKIGVEAEEKYKTKLDRVWPEFTTKSQKLKELEDQISKREEEEGRAKLEKGETLSPEEQRKIAQEEARKLDLVLTPDLEKKIDERYVQLRQGEKLVEDAEDMVVEAQEKYGIKTTVKDLLEHMAKPESPKNVEKAFKDMFEPQIDKWKETELGKKKGAGLVTEEASTAGAKEPKPIKITRENLGEQIKEVLGEG